MITGKSGLCVLILGIDSSPRLVLLDEKTSIQARRRKQPTLPPASDRPIRVEHQYFREGAWTYLAAWDVHRAKVFGRCEVKSGIAPVDPLVSEVMMFDEHTEALAHGVGLKVAHPPAKLRRHLDSKITTTRLAARAGIASVPNVLAPVNIYRALREVADGLGPDLVVQCPIGSLGTAGTANRP